VVTAALLTRWQAVLPDRAQLGDELIARWSEPHRHYHDLRHLGETLEALDLLGPSSGLEEIALWFHDAVHTNSAGVDEHRSAALAARKLRSAGLGAADTAEVVRLVLVTIDHCPEPGDLAGARVSDADLAILAAAPQRYRASVQALRAEAGQPDEQAWRTTSAHALVPHDCRQGQVGGPRTGQPRRRTCQLLQAVTFRIPAEPSSAGAPVPLAG
jgi:predicted metal-dependent HD superfamily phosphohydrolase